MLVFFLSQYKLVISCATPFGPIHSLKYCTILLYSHACTFLYLYFVSQMCMQVYG
uniref:Uncharacterized protein n=1 Tax=Triticum urartu TaxID=4572 RepID=A0A8R7V7B5_TRIUA